ncbi:glucose-6-phosphate isomerase [uncultured Helicobacter sp.]|uniref:glucose-6-phosphate isomerase n=1 Tax=uncultured Helicobacter sp. TaxID=175537 RepID=UPI00374EAEE9
MLTFKQSFTPTHKGSVQNIEHVFESIKQERLQHTSGYYELPFSKKALQDSQNYIKKHKDLVAKLKNLVIIGVGGSSLGLKALDSMLCSLPERNAIKLRFLECTDCFAVSDALKKLKVKNTLFIVISKSGSTIETSSLFKYVLEKYELLAPKNKSHLLAITDTNSPLQKWCQKQKIAFINIDKNVGGRFSVLSSVGILPLMLLGYKVKEILEGARELASRFFERKEDHILQKALYLVQNCEQYPINVLFSYSSVFKEFNAWYVQLWAESLGKLNAHKQSVGLTPVALVGSIDQHSFLQLIVQGPRDKSVTFISLSSKHYPKPRIPQKKLEFLESSDFINGASFATLLDKQCLATMQTLQAQEIPTDSIVVDKVCAYNAGALVMYYELLTSCAGCALEINTYDQPGVEFGKARLRDMF